jgi:putative transposase
MAYLSLLHHCVFSTKNRQLFIHRDIEERLWSYMGGIAKQNGFKALAIGGIEDHVHLLLSLHAVIGIAKAVQLIKAGSSKWMHEVIEMPEFGWQDSYGAFTVGISQQAATERYINRQRQHHAKVDFAAEWKMILKRHGLKVQPSLRD